MLAVYLSWRTNNIVKRTSFANNGAREMDSTHLMAEIIVKTMVLVSCRYLEYLQYMINFTLEQNDLKKYTLPVEKKQRSHSIDEGCVYPAFGSKSCPVVGVCHRKGNGVCDIYL